MNDIAQPPTPPLDLSHHDYYHLIHSLTRDLPPPLDDTPEALLARNQAAIDEVAAMLPTNANEAAFAARCVAARAQAGDVMCLLRLHADDIRIVMRLQAQYASMERTSQGAHAHLLRAQAVRYKREQSEAALKADEWTQYIATRSMQQALEAGRPRAVPTAVPAEPSPVAAPPPPAFRPVVALPPPVSAPAVARTSAAPRGSRRAAIAATSDEPPRDLRAEVAHYVAVYPERAREIRRCGGLPPNCSFGPPDDNLVAALLISNSVAPRVLDNASAAAE